MQEKKQSGEGMGSTGEEQLPNLEKLQMAHACEEKILVLVRLRPLNEKEIADNEVADWECINETTILYRNTLREGSTFPSAYTFDRVFRGDCATRQVYDEGAKEVALSVVSGINSSIFAYGQTSSGKTYTMMGITEYAVADIFDYINKHEERAFVLKFSAIEIYNEVIRDLLGSDTPLRLLDDAEKGTMVEKVTVEALKDWSHLQELLSVCEAQRRIGETSLNEKSSRSHQILRLTIESSAREFLGKENSTTLSATVNFVDLAGSERASQANSSGARLKEGCHINRSLLTLGTVIRKLSKGRHGHINYRDSKLTRLLQPALGGNARTAIICTLSPARSHVEQTRNTLLFACCAREVTTKAQVNVVMSDKALVKQLQKELARLESELRSPAPASTCDYAALLRKKDLQIQKMEKEIKELTKQRDLAESRVEDLLRMVGHEQTPRKRPEISRQTSWQAGDTWEDECSLSESSCMVDLHYPIGDVPRLNTMHFDGDSGSNIEEPYQFANNSEHHSISDGSSSVLLIGKNVVGASSCQSLEDAATGIAEDVDESCKEVQCIETEELSGNLYEHHSTHDYDGSLALTLLGDGNLARQGVPMPANGDGEGRHLQNGFTYDILEDRLSHVQRTINDIVGDPDDQFRQSLTADLSSPIRINSRRTWSRRENSVSGSPLWLEKLDQNESTPPNELEKQFTGRPEGLHRKFPALNYDADAGKLSRNGSRSSFESASTDGMRSQSIQASVNEDIPSINTFVAGLKEMAEKEYGKQLLDAEVQGTQALTDGSDKSVQDIGLDPMDEATETSRDWPLEFEQQQRAILELWQTCNVSLIHRTYFFLLFKGDLSDSIYMEVELRRLSFLKETFSQGIQAVRGHRTLTLASSIKSLHRERAMLSKLMRKRLSEEERKRLYQKWGVGVNSKRRRQQLTSRLWSNHKDIDHIRESASVVAKLLRFVEQGQALKEMFGLSFTPSNSKTKSLDWSLSKSSLI